MLSKLTVNEPNASEALSLFPNLVELVRDHRCSPSAMPKHAGAGGKRAAAMSERRHASAGASSAAPARPEYCRESVTARGDGRAAGLQR